MPSGLTWGRRRQFKFRATAGAVQRRQLIHELGEQGAGAVRRLFPGDDDPELSALYVLDVASEAEGRRLLRLLNASKAVEFAEPEVRRKLIR
jgi:hypothetical protein